MAQSQQNLNLKNKKSISRKTRFVAATSPNLDYIKMPELAGDCQESTSIYQGSGKKIKPNFFHKYQKKSQFLNSNQENHTGMVFDFLQRKENLQSPVADPDSFSEEENEASIGEQIPASKFNLKQMKFSKMAKSHGQLDCEHLSKNKLNGNFEFQCEISETSWAKSQSRELASNESERQSRDHFKSNNASSVDSLDDLLNRKCSEDIMFSKKELSKDESLLSHSSGNNERADEDRKNGNCSSSFSEKMKSKKFRMEIEIEKRQQLEKQIRNQTRAKGTRTKKTGNVSRTKMGKVRRKNQLKNETFKNKEKAEMGRKKKKPKEKVNKKVGLDLADLGKNRKSLNLKNNGFLFKMATKNVKKSKQSKKLRELAGLIHKMPKASFKSSKTKFSQLKSNPYSISGMKLWEGALLREKKKRAKDKKAKKRKKGLGHKMNKMNPSQKADFKKMAKLSKTHLNNSRKMFQPGKKSKLDQTKKAKKLNPSFKYVSERRN